MLVLRPAQESDFGAIARVFHDAVHQVAKRNYTEEQLQPVQAMGYHTVRKQTVCCGGVDLRNYRMEKTLTP